MSRISHADILVELVDFCQEVCSNIKQQLNYYNASVYKHETANNIKKKIDHLQRIMTQMNDDLLMEPFKDYEATILNGNVATVPGECLFSTRVYTLVNNIEKIMDELSQTINNQGQLAHKTNISNNIQKNKRHIQALCRRQTLPWGF